MAFAKSLSLRHDASTALAVGSLVRGWASSSRLGPDFAGSCCMDKCLQCAVGCSGMCFVLEPRALSMQMWMGAGSLELTSAPWLEKQRSRPWRLTLMQHASASQTCSRPCSTSSPARPSRLRRLACMQPSSRAATDSPQSSFTAASCSKQHKSLRAELTCNTSRLQKQREAMARDMMGPA